jgi:hypothetical protein
VRVADRVVVVVIEADGTLVKGWEFPCEAGSAESLPEKGGLCRETQAPLACANTRRSGLRLLQHRR